MHRSARWGCCGSRRSFHSNTTMRSPSQTQWGTKAANGYDDVLHFLVLSLSGARCCLAGQSSESALLSLPNSSRWEQLPVVETDKCSNFCRSRAMINCKKWQNSKKVRDSVLGTTSSASILTIERCKEINIGIKSEKAKYARKVKHFFACKTTSLAFALIWDSTSLLWIWVLSSWTTIRSRTQMHFKEAWISKQYYQFFACRRYHPRYQPATFQIIQQHRSTGGHVVMAAYSFPVLRSQMLMVCYAFFVSNVKIFRK